MKRNLFQSVTESQWGRPVWLPRGNPSFVWLSQSNLCVVWLPQGNLSFVWLPQNNLSFVWLPHGSLSFVWEDCQWQFRKSCAISSQKLSAGCEREDRRSLYLVCQQCTLEDLHMAPGS